MQTEIRMEGSARARGRDRRTTTSSAAVGRLARRGSGVRPEAFPTKSRATLCTPRGGLKVGATSAIDGVWSVARWRCIGLACGAGGLWVRLFERAVLTVLTISQGARSRRAEAASRADNRKGAKVGYPESRTAERTSGHDAADGRGGLSHRCFLSLRGTFAMRRTPHAGAPPPPPRKLLWPARCARTRSTIGGSFPAAFVVSTRPITRPALPLDALPHFRPHIVFPPPQGARRGEKAENRSAARAITRTGWASRTCAEFKSSCDDCKSAHGRSRTASR